MAQHLSALAVLSEDPGSTYGTHIMAPNCLQLQSWGSNALFWCLQAWCTDVYPDKIPTQIKEINKKFKNGLQTKDEESADSANLGR